MEAKHTPERQFTLDDDELRILVTHHTKRFATLLGRADNYRAFAPDKDAAREEAEARAEAETHRLRAEQLAAAIAKATGGNHHG